MNYRTFETIIKKQVKTLEEPAVEMLHKITGESSRVCLQAGARPKGSPPGVPAPATGHLEIKAKVGQRSSLRSIRRAARETRIQAEAQVVFH